MPSVAQLAELARPQRLAEAFICGPGPFMDAAVAAFLQLIDMPGAQVHVERFVSLPEEDAQGPVLTQPTAEEMVDEAEVELRLDGQVHHLRCAGTETLLRPLFVSALLHHFLVRPGCALPACAR